MSRPKPQQELLQSFDTWFVYDANLQAWAKETFIAENASLFNPEHQHLTEAFIGFLWTNQGNTRRGKRIVGEASLGQPKPNQGKWAKDLEEFQLIQFFGQIPDFKIILDAHYAIEADDVSFCALIEHELYHCGQAKDDFGFPKFSRTTGKPKFAMVSHDVEEFVGIVRRYGVDAGAGETKALVNAAKRVPEIGKAKVAGACGTCALKLA